MTPIQAAVVLRRSRDAVYTMITRGELRGTQGPTGRWEISEQDVAALALRETAPGLALTTGAR